MQILKMTAATLDRLFSHLKMPCVIERLKSMRVRKRREGREGKEPKNEQGNKKAKEQAPRTLILA